MEGVEHEFEEEKDKQGFPILKLLQSKLMELSITPNPADENALIKAMYDESKKAIQEPPLEPEDTLPAVKVPVRHPKMTPDEFKKEKRAVARKVSKSVYKAIIEAM